MDKTKLTDREIANFFKITPQTIVLWKKEKPLRYKAIKTYIFFEKYKIPKQILKLKGLFLLVEQDCECNSKYLKEMKEIINSLADFFTEINIQNLINKKNN